MGLFNEVIKMMFGNTNKNDVSLSWIENGEEYAINYLVTIINEKITSLALAKQFILEELDAARFGNEVAINFAKNSGIKEDEYVDAMRKTKWVGNESELENLQLNFRLWLLKIDDDDLRVRISMGTVDKIMKIWKFGKYNLSEINTLESFNKKFEVLLNSKNIFSEDVILKLVLVVKEIKRVNDLMTRIPSEENINNTFIVAKIAVLETKNIIDYFHNNDISEVDSTIILTAFYIVNMCHIMFRNPLDISKEEIQNIFTSIKICSTNNMNYKPSDVSLEKIEIIRIIVKWLLEH